MKPINEDSANTVTVRFYNPVTGAEITPTSAKWRLRDVTNKRILQDWTPIGVTGTSLTIAIPAELNTIYNDRNSYEDHAVSVQADEGLTTQHTDEVIYKVKNLKAFK